MRHVYEHPGEAAAKGRAARQLMVSKYSPEAVGSQIAAELGRINGMIRWGLQRVEGIAGLER